MGKRLTKREFEYKSNLFEALGIKREDAVGKSLEQLSKLIGKKYRTLSLKSHPDKNGGSNEKMKALTNSKDNVVTYIIPLGLGNNLILLQETIDFFKESMQISEATRRGYEAQYSSALKHTCFILLDLYLLCSCKLHLLYI